MPTKDYRIWIDQRAFIVVEMVMFKGKVVSFVVRLMFVEGEFEINVARYDTSHGTPHRDVLGRRGGLVEKTWYADLTLDRVLRDAIRDFRRHYESYIEAYQTH